MVHPEEFVIEVEIYERHHEQHKDLVILSPLNVLHKLRWQTVSQTQVQVCRIIYMYIFQFIDFVLSSFLFVCLFVCFVCVCVIDYHGTGGNTRFRNYSCCLRKWFLTLNEEKQCGKISAQPHSSLLHMHQCHTNNLFQKQQVYIYSLVTTLLMYSYIINVWGCAEILPVKLCKPFW